MNSRHGRTGWLLLVVVQLVALASPLTARAVEYCAGRPEPAPISECEENWCNLQDGAWDSRFLPFGAACGAVDGVTGTQLGFCNTGRCVQPERGRITPLYMILDAQYSPPGLGSSVSSSQSKSMGVKTSVGSSFTRTGGTTITVGVSSGLGKAGAEVSVESGDTTASEDSVTVVRKVTSTELLGCDPLFLCTDAIDHRLDVIYVLANPAVEYSAFPAGTTLPPGHKTVEWGLDASAAVVVPLRVGWLTGVLEWPNGLPSDLEAYFGITAAEYPKILSATGYGYAMQWAGDWNPDPRRYELAPLMNDAPGFGYYYGAPDYGGDVANSRTIEQTDTYQTNFSVAIKAGVGFNIGTMLSVGVENKFSWKWTQSTSTTTSAVNETTESFFINMPPPEYSGRRFMWAYLDKLYQTFAFSFCSSDYPVPGCASGPPVPTEPTGLAAAAAPTHSSVSVSWTPVAGATGYTLWRSTSEDDASFVAVMSNLDAFSFEDQGATASAVPYYYKVHALNGSGKSLRSSLAMVPAAPTGLAATVSGGTVSLSWAPTAGAVAYAVWRSSDGSTFSKLTCASPATTQCTDAAPPFGTRYSYAVTASSPTGSSSYSNQASVAMAPATPIGLAVGVSDVNATITWNAVPGATSYDVERSVSSTMSSPTTFTGLWMTTLYNTGLPLGTTYYYRVRAVAAGAASAWSSAVAGTTRPPAPTGLTASPGDRSVTLAWPATPGATSYIVAWSAYSNMAYLSAMSGVTSRSVTITGLTNGTTYYFRIRANNAAGVSDYSPIVSARPVAPPPPRPPPPDDPGCPPPPRICQ